MKKEQVISFVKSELESGYAVLIATMGNGGSGEGLIGAVDFPRYLESLEFVGEVKPADDIAQSKHYDPKWRTYQFNGHNGFFLQLQAK